MQGWHVANSLETLARLDALEGEFHRSAILAAGATRLREEIGVPLEPALLGEWDEFLRTLAHNLTEGDFADASQSGRTYSIEDLIGMAVALPIPSTNDIPLGNAEGSGSSQDNLVAPLTPREYEVLELLVEGRTNPEIAHELFISPRTVSVHVTHILEKLSVENRSAAVALALRSGLVTPSDQSKVSPEICDH